MPSNVLQYTACPLEGAPHHSNNMPSQLLSVSPGCWGSAGCSTRGSPLSGAAFPGKIEVSGRSEAGEELRRAAGEGEGEACGVRCASNGDM